MLGVRAHRLHDLAGAPDPEHLAPATTPVNVRLAAAGSLLAGNLAAGNRIGHSEPTAPFAHSRSTRTVTLGIPHLGPNGLAEGWLLRELGQAHWELIEECLDQEATKWADGAGRPLYATFVAVSLEGTLLANAFLGARLTLAARVERVRLGTFASRCELVAAGGARLTAELISVFVRRDRPADNQSFVRPDTGGTLARGPSPSRSSCEMLLTHRGLKNVNANQGAGSGTTIPVVPALDFNCLGMLYFANYPAFVERGSKGQGGPLRSRRLFYFGNVNAGDGVVARRLSGSTSRDSVQETSHLSRASDGACIGVCETTRTNNGA